MKQYTIASLLALAVVAAACGSEHMNNSMGVGPEIQVPATLAQQPGIQCSDTAPAWKTKNYSTSSRSFLVDWFALPGVQTYEVEVSYSRDGLEPKRLLRTFRTNRSNATLPDSEDGGRYYIRVRVTHNDCGDVDGAFGSELTVIIAGDAGDVGGNNDDSEEEGEYAICHVDGQGGEHQKFLSENAAEAHLSQHENDYEGYCEQVS